MAYNPSQPPKPTHPLLISCKQWKHYMKGLNKQQLLTWPLGDFFSIDLGTNWTNFALLFFWKLWHFLQGIKLEENESCYVLIMEHLKYGFWWYKGLVLFVWCTSHGKDSMDKQKFWENTLQCTTHEVYSFYIWMLLY